MQAGVWRDASQAGDEGCGGGVLGFRSIEDNSFAGRKRRPEDSMFAYGMLSKCATFDG